MYILTVYYEALLITVMWLMGDTSECGELAVMCENLNPEKTFYTMLLLEICMSRCAIDQQPW